jgi:hypothetical protein
MALKIGTTDISNVYRESTLLSAIYTGTNLIWPSTPIGSLTKWNTTGLNQIILSEDVTATEPSWITNGINTKFN